MPIVDLYIILGTAIFFIYKICRKYWFTLLIFIVDQGPLIFEFFLNPNWFTEKIV